MNKLFFVLQNKTAFISTKTTTQNSGFIIVLYYASWSSGAARA